MSVIQNFVERSEPWRRVEEIQAIRNGDVNTSGTSKDVYEGLRGKVKPMPDKQFVEEHHEELTGSELVADADVNSLDLREIGLWEDTRVINQDCAAYTLDEAIDHYGVDEVVDRTVNRLLDGFVEQGVVFKDPKDNIGFFYGRPRSFDVYDSSAFMIFDEKPENMSKADFYSFESAAPNMYGQFAEDVANKSDRASEEVIGKVAEASDYLEDEIEDYLCFQDAFEYDTEL